MEEIWRDREENFHVLISYESVLWFDIGNIVAGIRSRANPAYQDASCFQTRQIEILRHQVNAYMALVQGMSPPSSSLLYLSTSHITSAGRLLAAGLYQRPLYSKSQYIAPPPPLDGPEGTVDWPGQLYPQLRVARVRKRALEVLGSEEDVSRLVKLIEAQRRLRNALLDHRLAFPSALPKRQRFRGGFGVGTSGLEQHTKFLSDLLMHRQQFVDFHRKHRELQRRVVHALVRKLTNGGLPAASETAEERLQRERIAALKAQDEDAYLRLLAESKNERLNELIQQTEEYMRTLGALVLQHKAPGSTVLQEADKADSISQHGLLRAKAEYFALTHAIQEPVREQPLSLTKHLKLRDYQLKGLEYLVSLHNNRLSGILADEQGLGKSATTIAFLAWLWEHRGVGGPFMIIAPLSVLKSTWVAEFRRWCSFLADGVVVYEGHKEQRKELKSRYIDPMVKVQNGQIIREVLPFNVLLTTDSFILKEQNILRKVNWEYIIVDEAHRLKNPKSKLVQVLNKNFNSKSRLALTGTPLQNDLQEVWALLNFLMPKIFGSNDSFKDWFSGPLAAATRRGGAQLANADLSEEEKLLVIDRLHKVLKPFILRRSKNEVMEELPRKTEQVVWCRMTGVQQRLYDDLVTAAGTASSTAVWETGKGQNLQMNLRKVCNHPYLFVPASVPADESLIRVCGKLVMLDGILARLKASTDNHRVLIFSQMTKLLDVLEMFMNYRNHSYVRLDGNTSSELREDTVKRFNAPGSEIFCFLLSTRAGGLGLNLQSADTVILYDQDYNPAGDEQAKSRSHRMGQTKEVLTLRLVTVDSIEERMLEIAETKQQQDELVIQQGRYHHDLDLGIDEKRDKLLEILARRNSGQNKDEDLDTLQMERGEDERWLFEKVDRRMDTLGFRKGIDQPVIPPCLLKSSEEIGEECHQNELKLWKEAYQSLDLSYSLKLLVRKSPVVGGSDFEEEIKLKRHKLNEAVFTTMDGCLKQFGWTEKQAPVIYETKTAARNGLFMSLHEVERTLNKVLDFASTSEYLWSFKLVGALNCRVRRLLFPADFLKEASEASSEPEEEEDTEESMDEVLGFTQFLMNE